jgi:sodium-dependent dicarboxylate transporter 2/3/5
MGMLISNTATAIMMLPLAISMALLLSGRTHEDPDTNCPFAKAMVLGVVYSCVIGGLSSFIGAPTNAIMVGFVSAHYDKALSLSDWMEFGIPIAIILLAFTWAMLCYLFLRKSERKQDVRNIVNDAHQELGVMSREEKVVSAVFIFTATLWVFSHSIQSFLMFLMPTNLKFNTFALNWKDTAKLPWGILVFFGGSMSLSTALTDSGVTLWLSQQLSLLSGMNIMLVVILITLLLIAVSELMNNVATITAFLPILAAMATAMQINPLIIMIPATLAASCAFMLPGASAPNALAYGTGHLRVSDMIRSGLVLNIISAISIAIFTFTVVATVYHIDFNHVPDWAILKH